MSFFESSEKAARLKRAGGSKRRMKAEETIEKLEVSGAETEEWLRLRSSQGGRE